MSSLKKFDYRIKDNRKRNIFLCGIMLVIITIVGVKLYQSKAEFTSTTNEMNLTNGSVVIPATHYLKVLAKTSDELVYDETEDNNLRYIGADPNNYVWFNDELWRIIGVMNNVDDGTGKKEQRVKLIKTAKPTIEGEMWDENRAKDWTKSPLNSYLNETFFNELSSESQSMIDNSVWYLGKSISNYYNNTKKETIKATPNAENFYN